MIAWRVRRLSFDDESEAELALDVRTRGFAHELLEGHIFEVGLLVASGIDDECFRHVFAIELQVRHSILVRGADELEAPRLIRRHLLE